MSNQTPNDSLVYKTTYAVLCLVAFLSMSASILHHLEPQPEPLDLVLPPSMFVIFFTLWVALILRSDWLLPIIKMIYFFSLLALVIPSWFYTIQAYLEPSIQLVEIYPPISSLLFPLIIIAMVFFNPIKAMIVTLLAWLFIAVPVLFYLVIHTDELWTSRGQDMLVSYGPALLTVLILVPFYQQLRNKIKTLNEKHDRMQNLAESDVLTHLPNRRAAENVLAEILKEKSDAGVLLFDIDYFKKINDNHGHAIGDDVLQVIAKRCLNVLRKEGAISRWGGEEFIVILDEVDKATLMNIAERLRLAISTDKIEPAGYVTASFGATLIEKNDSASTLLERVDQALYKAKASDKNCVIFYPLT